MIKQTHTRILLEYMAGQLVLAYPYETLWEMFVEDWSRPSPWTAIIRAYGLVK